MRKSALALCALGAMTLSSTAYAADPIAKVSGGALVGKNEPGLRVFLGLPYAAPPVGELRWREPQPVRPWSGRRAAKQFSASCTQDEPKPFGPYTAAFMNPPERSEDCLYLNVWAPAKRSARRPVLVFIHGGAYQAGGTNNATMHGGVLARKGAVVVTINYRLGMLGFFAHPELTKELPLGTSGNYGVLDAIAALRWVRANIVKFGGDPSNVTIAGQSAGAGMVNALLHSQLASGLFHRAILESGPALGMPMQTLAAAEASGKASVAKAKVNDIAGLRSIPATDLKTLALAGFPFPIVDGKILQVNPEKPEARLTSKVPVIIGYTRDESASEEEPKTVAAFESRVKTCFGALTGRALALYPHATDAEAAQSGLQLSRDRRVAGLILWAERRSSEGVPVYAYHFEHVFPGSDPARFGAFHSSEILYVFGAMKMEGVNFTAEDRQISDSVQKRWLAFMRSGDPGPAGTATAWRRTSSDPSTIWRIDPADAEPLLDTERLALFRAYQANGGSLGLF